MSTLRKFLLDAKKLIEDDPKCLDMEMFGECGSSGALYEMSSLNISKVSSWKNSEFPLEEMLPSDYSHDSIVRVYLGN
jgi:hypothetical protein